MINPSEAYVTIPANEYADLVNAKEELLAALKDMLSEWRYIRETQSDFYGVWWDGAEAAATAAIAKWGPS